ncbi:MAG: glycosyltransferase [Lachnospiraceae bacterium]|nr:glycosyltransferase [Lachnospiraceae bacterium]
MNVVYASNENYVRHMAASMVSLFEQNQKRRKLTVYVFSIGIRKESRMLLENMAGGYGRRIRWVELGDIREQFDFGIDTGGFDVSTMARLFVGRLLPAQVQRVLYLDCDTVVVRPLGRLWNTDLGENIIGAVMEPTIYQAVRQEIGLRDSEPYINAGVLLIDLRRWRESGAEKKLLDFYRKKGGSLFACDQDIINGVLKGQICFLPPCYNFFTNYRYFSYRELVRQSESYRAVGRKRLIQAKRCPAILHFAGDERPWVAGNFNHYRKFYERALELTPWAGTPREGGREAYMLAYHLMNYLTVLCPPARRLISKSLGMRAVNARKGRRNGGEKEQTKQPGGSTDSGKEQILVLLAAYQGAIYIAEQLDSILAQTVPRIRILISDDGSTDGTREILEYYQRKYPGQIRLCHRVKQGIFQDRDLEVPAPAMNFFWLLSQEEADYVLLCDQDDVWHPQKVEKLLARMHEMEEENVPALVFSDMEVVDAALNRISPSFFAYSQCHPERTSLSEILVENPVTGGTLMMNRFLQRLVTEPPKACFMHDWWIALCASCFGRISCVKEPLSQYRQHGGNTLGARHTGSMEDLWERGRRQKEVEENYQRMFQQAAAFGMRFGRQLSASQKRILHEFLALPRRTAAERLLSILKYRYFKSSCLQTLAQCATIPGTALPERKHAPGKNKGEEKWLTGR